MTMNLWLMPAKQDIYWAFRSIIFSDELLEESAQVLLLGGSDERQG